MNKFNKNWENDVLNKIPEGIFLVKNELSPLLNEKVESESVIDNSMNILDNPTIDNMSAGQGQSNSKVKVRTIGARTNMPLYANPAVSTENNIYQGNNDNYYQEPVNSWKNGFTDYLILLGIGCLVLLVFVVSYLMINYFS